MLQIHYVRNILNLEYPMATISTLSQCSIFKILQINDISYLNHFPFSTYRAQKIVHYISLQACIFYAFNILDLTNNFLIARVQYSFKIILVENMQQNRDWLHPKKKTINFETRWTNEGGRKGRSIRGTLVVAPNLLSTFKS